ncbi:MAG: rhodanese-like domain-containing protein, partial [Proteobacteria bacterium]|nr:rhodanese-like domain-containing protein [Pseudomonadota bacterium]
MFISLSIEESKKKIQDGLSIVDVRQQNEYDQIRIPNSYLIPLNIISKEIVESKLGENVDIIIHCKSGIRSKAAANILAQQGYKGKIFEIDNGIMGWIESNQITESNN